MVDESISRKKIPLISFIYSVLIVFFHAGNSIYYNLDNSVDPLAKVAVYMQKIVNFNGYLVAIPTFFMISGYLFYKNMDYGKIVEKYKSRFFSLVIPYLFFNVFFTLCWFLMEPSVVTVNSGNILKIIFFYHYNSPFWYIYQLILYVIMCPVLFTIFKNRYLIYVFFLGCSAFLLFSGGRLSIFTVKIDSILFYAVGAYIATHAKDLVFYPTKTIHRIMGIIAIALSEVYFIFMGYVLKSPLLDCLFRLLMCFGAWVVFDYFVTSKTESKKYWEFSFIIYALHDLVLIAFRIFVRPLLPVNPISAIILYIIPAIFTVVLIVILARILKKYCRPFYLLISGGR